MKQTKEEFLRFLDDTLIPDLAESGRKATAEDLQRCHDLAKWGEKDARFAKWLKTTLIPDLRASGHTHTAADFTRCTRYIAPAKRRKARRR